MRDDFMGVSMLLEQYKVHAAIIAAIFALADAWTTREVIKRQKDGTRKGREGNWLPAKAVAKWGLTKYLIVSRAIVFAALWFEPAAGYPLAVAFAFVTYNNWRNMQ